MIRKEVIPYFVGGLFVSSFFYLIWLEPLAIASLILCVFFFISSVTLREFLQQIPMQ